ncbi:aromatic ring-hydroxylating oxygenase subunit alpha [Roseibacillus persicicus]|uniref:(2Fe-2S)-binding protein n=1 Tax=Roseibacillus persicicus TaxID=454148 RepID=A0A918TQE8_9BACT|nr:aromatic ring-hydroxylating dioxygenase subunit alpha [Roseibacillus persicicus]GHC57262.1 (2Fe-2S)-binding protein [Roseibacillus persicicus]
MRLTEERVREACAMGTKRPAVGGAQSNLEELLAQIEESADLPLPQAMSLPSAAYTSEEFFQWENEEVFRKEWLCVGHVSQIPLAGDFLNLDLLGEPLIVVRGKDEQVRVLSRVCPHRAMDIMPEGFGYDGHGIGDRREEGGPDCGHARLFLCRYHSWTFELDGGLKACPEMQEAEDFCRDEVGLKEFRSEVWEGFVFVNLDGEAPISVGEQLAGLQEKVAKWNCGEMVVVNAQEWDCPFNWKVMIENFMESYHHAGAHAKSLQTMMPAKDTWTEEEKAHYIRCHLPMKEKVRKEIAEQEAKGGQWDAFPKIEGLSDEERHEWGLHLGFPTFMFVVLADCAIWYRLQPESAGRCKLVTTMLVPGETVKEEGFAEMLERGVREATEFHLEDMEVCTAVQRGHYSRVTKPGRLSHLEMPVWLIQRYLAARSRGTWPTQDREPAQSQK